MEHPSARDRLRGERRTRALLAVAAVSAAVAIVATGVSVWAVTTEPVAAPTVAAEGPGPSGLTLHRQAGSPERTVDYSFGHTIGSTVPSPDARLDASMRVPFELGAAATAFRVHLRNWRFDTEEVFTAPVTVTGLAVGAQEPAAPGGEAASADADGVGPPAITSLTGSLSSGAVAIADTRNLPAEGLVTDWILPEQLELEAHTSYLLAVGFTTPAGSTLATTPGLSWIDADAGSGRAADAGVVGTPRSSSYFDVWIEYRVAAEVPVLVSVGHSLNAPGSYDETAFPTRGQQTAWPQQWALSNDAAAITFASPGAQTPVFTPTAQKWNEYGDIDPDVVTLWTASNDIAHGRPLGDIQRDWSAILSRVRQLWPEARVYAMTEPPRGLTGGAEQTRLDWNAWLALVPPGVDRVIDADYALRDPASPSRLRADVDADGIHFSARGHSLIAGLVPVPRP
ncbi:SGNH/GDSL hydrolase family protein [Herbiconiux sp. P18]|uniref:SGNH/GDSL hydrolase family protein n=1 Tax=Herbiconiux liangxiaofengii TaxID=3342795 RepID=UPI0035B9D61F